MNGHDRNMLWQAHRTQSASRVLLSVVLLTIIDLVSTATLRDGNNCNKIQKSVKLSLLSKRSTAESLKEYESSQGDFAELFCKMPMDNVPASTLSGQTSSERVLNIYSRLKEFLPHVKKVQDQQEDLQPSLSESLFHLRGRLEHLALRVDSIIQILQPNIPLPEPPTRTLPAQNTFQQKVYGCVVLTRLSEFLSTVVNELRSLKSSMCIKKSWVMSKNY